VTGKVVHVHIDDYDEECTILGSLIERIEEQIDIGALDQEIGQYFIENPREAQRYLDDNGLPF
jgi:ArsR family metal-binding transcriptional regulator